MHFISLNFVYIEIVYVKKKSFCIQQITPNARIGCRQVATNLICQINLVNPVLPDVYLMD